MMGIPSFREDMHRTVARDLDLDHVPTRHDLQAHDLPSRQALQIGVTA
jgi:hypothetical protein